MLTLTQLMLMVTNPWLDLVRLYNVPKHSASRPCYGLGLWHLILAVALCETVTLSNKITSTWDLAPKPL